MKIKTHEPGKFLLWLIGGPIAFVVFFIIDNILTVYRLQFWINHYHIHHSFVGLLLVAVSSAILTYRWKKRQEVPHIVIGALFLGIVLMIEWGFSHYTECGGRYLLITKNE